MNSRFFTFYGRTGSLGSPEEAWLPPSWPWPCPTCTPDHRGGHGDRRYPQASTRPGHRRDRRPGAGTGRSARDAGRRIRRSFMGSAGSIVFGMGDGTVSIFGLVFGVAAAAPDSHAVLLAGGTARCRPSSRPSASPPPPPWPASRSASSSPELGPYRTYGGSRIWCAGHAAPGEPGHRRRAAGPGHRSGRPGAGGSSRKSTSTRGVLLPARCGDQRPYQPAAARPCLATRR
jgi:hypothetical protein